MAGVRSDIPHHLVVEILSWLPFASVVSLRCVCKAWNALTRDPFFVDLHRRRSTAAAGKSRASYIYLPDEPVLAHLYYEPAYTGAGGTRVTTLPLFQEGEEHTRSCAKISIRSHCRGLTCISHLHSKKKLAVSVHNLATGEYRVLATLPAGGQFSFHLGFDRCTNRYKLLHLEPSRTGDDNEDYDLDLSTMKPAPAAAEVYTLGDAPGAWRRLPDYCFPVGTFTGATSWKGNPTWMRAPPPDRNRVQVVWFDMAREEFLTMAGPKEGMLEDDERAVEIFPWWNDALAMAIHSERRAAMEMWVLTDHEDLDQSVLSWSPQWSIRLDSLSSWNFKIVGPWPGGKLMVASYFDGLATVGPSDSPGGSLIKKVELPLMTKGRRWPAVGIIPHLDTFVSLQDIWNEGQSMGSTTTTS